MNKIKICTILILLVLIGLIGCSKKVETATKMVNSEDMRDTQITSALQDKIPEQKNLIYCSTFQLAWNELKDGIIKEPIQLESQPLEVNYLNQGLVTKDDLSSKDYVAMSGFDRDKIVDRINEELKDKFGHEANLLSKGDKKNIIVAYAFLYKHLKFPFEFETLKRGIFFNTIGKPTKVLGFGINSDTSHEEFDKMAKQVDIYDYQSPDNFIISLQTEGEKDELVLAKIQPKDTLLATFQQVQKRLNKGPKQKLAYGDPFAIPAMNFNIEHTFENLLNKPFKNKGFEVFQIDEAKQNILFKLNERGVTLESESLVGVKQAITQDKRIVFDKPFLLYLKEKTAKYPYLVLWINNPELLVTE